MNRNLPKSRLNREEAFGELKILLFRPERRKGGKVGKWTGKNTGSSLPISCLTSGRLTDLSVLPAIDVNYPEILYKTRSKYFSS
jgi:hypothetical protein